MFFQNVTNNHYNNNITHINNSSAFHQQFDLKVVDNNSVNKKSKSSSTVVPTSSTSSAGRKRTQTWIEGIAVLNKRNSFVTNDVEEAWENLMRILPKTHQPQQDDQRLYCASLSSTNSNFLSEFGYNNNNTFKQNEDFFVLQQPTTAPFIVNEEQQTSTNSHSSSSSILLDFETQQVLSTHRTLKQSQDRLKKDELGIANLIANATEQLDLGEGLTGTSVARVRSANKLIETNLNMLREEERALGDVAGDAEKVVAMITKKIMMSNTTTSAAELQQQQNQQKKHQSQYFDPMSNTTEVNTTKTQSQQQKPLPTTAEIISSTSADEKLKQFLNRVGGRSFGWPQQEHDCFMHVLFSGGFEDPAVTNATPNLGLRFSSNHQHQQQNNLADDEQWVAARVVEKLTPLLPHRLPDDIRRHLHLQRELEFLEGQRRLEIKSWRDQREADATLDLGLAAALAREDAELESQNRRETEFERRARQEQLHELVDMWKHKKEEAAATAKAAMAVTQRALLDAQVSKRAAIQAASKERNRQLLERRQMLKNAALWSTAAKALGASSPHTTTMSGDLAAANHANRQHNIPISCSSNMDKAALNYALQERREQALNKARERRAAVEALEKQKNEREEKMMVRAELVRTASSPVGGVQNNNRNNSTTTTSRLFQPTKSTNARRQATVEQETAANLASKALCRQTPYFTPRTMSSHRGAAPFSKK